MVAEARPASIRAPRLRGVAGEGGEVAAQFGARPGVERLHDRARRQPENTPGPGRFLHFHLAARAAPAAMIPAVASKMPRRTPRIADKVMHRLDRASPVPAMTGRGRCGGPVEGAMKQGTSHPAKGHAANYYYAGAHAGLGSDRGRFNRDPALPG